MSLLMLNHPSTVVDEYCIVLAVFYVIGFTKSWYCLQFFYEFHTGFLLQSINEYIESKFVCFVCLFIIYNTIASLVLRHLRYCDLGCRDLACQQDTDSR